MFVKSNCCFIFGLSKRARNRVKGALKKMEFAQIILQQLGGRKFIAMTGCKNFLYESITPGNPLPSLIMTVPKNKSKANRLRISVLPNDTYKMEFLEVTVKRGEVKTIKVNEYSDVYDTMLQELFTRVTGMYTKL